MAAERPSSVVEAADVVVDHTPNHEESIAALNVGRGEPPGQELQEVHVSCRSPSQIEESLRRSVAVSSKDDDVEAPRSSSASPDGVCSFDKMKTRGGATFRVRAAQQAEKQSQLIAMVARGRARQWLKRNEMGSAVISVCYLVLIFLQIVLEEMPLGDDFNSWFIFIFAYVDLAFLVFFAGEYAAHMLVDGIRYFRKVDGTWEKLYLVDASTVVVSLVLSSLNAAKVIDTQLSIFRMFRLLRLPAG